MAARQTHQALVLMALCLSIASVTAEECIECTGGVCCPEGCAGEGNCLCDAGYLGCSTSDLTLNDIASDVCSWGSKDGVAAFSSSNSNCNPGDQKTIYWDWGVYGDKGSLVGQQAYRLKNDRFEQIGMSWLKYAWAGAHGTNTCSSRCCYTGSNDHLPAGCIDVYSATNNANQAAFGPRSHVNRVTGEALALIASCYDPQQPGGIDNICGRLQVAHDDLDPDLNEGATYFVEHHWITSCEDLRDNNAAYREIVVDEDPDGCCGSSTSCTYVIEPAPSSATVTETPAAPVDTLQPSLAARLAERSRQKADTSAQTPAEPESPPTPRPSCEPPAAPGDDAPSEQRVEPEPEGGFLASFGRRDNSGRG